MKKRQKEQFLSDFRKYRDKCNEEAIKKGLKQHNGNKYYISIIMIDLKPHIVVSGTNEQCNEFVLLGYFYDYRDAYNATKKYEQSILKLYKDEN
ncbi:hypothetical protein HZY83_05400 [Gemella sp. GH3]|uniref:hypothetical protein n=1 Tax=unclassified Gemella TaxID=2624949 RepID=UPI0015D08C6E|nr:MULTISPECIES: hypothetical protein [unclassified Gemella]MBF0714107.1 hypothetical protein [Gemella sp. GH3.1]NYS51059.1 hypothetical protein [Gemella sp. GH3]